MNTPQVDSAPTFLPIAERPVTVGRSDEATLRLSHPTVSRRHATLKSAGVGVIIEDHHSRCGTFVNGVRIRVTTANPGDRVQFGAAVAYRVERGGLRLDHTAEGMTLAAEGLSVSVPGSMSWGRLRDNLQAAGATADWSGLLHSPRKVLIESVSFRIPPDSFVGILAPSGAGKSTTLHCLAGYLKPDRGRVSFDDDRDVFTEQDAYRKLVGHVPQDDVVFRSLTARENLTDAARLRLSEQPESTEIAAVVAEVLERVGLGEHADKPTAILSGGQRKRLSVAIELLRRPRLLFLDEPTSGLDPASETHLMEQLRHVAQRGTTVVCTTHLMDNIRLFDEVIVLGMIEEVGRIAYTGPPDGMLAHFGCRGFADLYEALEVGRFEPIEAQRVEPTTGAATRAPTNHGAVARIQASPQTIATGTEPGHAPSPQALVIDHGWQQFFTVTHRGLRLVLRDRGLLVMVLAQPLFLAVLVSLTQYDIGKILPLFFFAIVIAIWLGLNNSARDLVRERRHYLRDRLSGLEPMAYLGAKTAVHVVIGIAQLLLFLGVLRVGCGRTIQQGRVAEDLLATSNLALFLLLLVCYLGGVALGLLVSTLVRTEATAVAALPLLIMPQMLISVVATGMQPKRYEEERPFRPLVVTIKERQDAPGPDVIVDLASILCFSRPATLVAESLALGGAEGKWTWVADLAHLVILLLATWASLILAFQWAERRWLRLDGLE